MRADKIRFVFLIGILCGVIMAAAVTFTLAIPANNIHWQAEIVKRGGGTWYFDKNGHMGWKWIVEPISYPHRRSESSYRPLHQVCLPPGIKQRMPPA